MVRNSRTSLDTNILLRFILGDVPEQSDRIDKLLAGGGKFEVADVAIIETVFVLESYYDMGRPDVIKSILMVINHPSFICNKTMFLRALKNYQEYQQLSLVDCALLEYARLNKTTPLYTFDKKLVIKSKGDAVQP